MRLRGRKQNRQRSCLSKRVPKVLRRAVKLGNEEMSGCSIQPFQGCAGYVGLTQGRRWRANPGLSDHNPVGVVAEPGGRSRMRQETT